MKVIYKTKLAGRLLVDVEGSDHPIRCGTRVVDENGNESIIQSIAMTCYVNPEDRRKQTTLVLPLAAKVGNTLNVKD